MLPQAPIITTLGSRAQRLMASSSLASVWGSISKGIFLHLPPQGMIFLSYEPHRGPLTANLAGDLTGLRCLTHAAAVQIAEGRISFPGYHVSIDLGGGTVWDIPPLPQVPVDMASVATRYQQVHRLVTAQLGEETISLTIQPSPGSKPSSSSLLQILLPLLGLGKGLTPAGDDQILGFLLAMHRWGASLVPGFEIGWLSQELASAAYQKTALLSANLIECAASGQADERLVLALDGIFTGCPSLDRCCSALLDWGDSSGRAALAGMGLALSLVRR